MMNEPINARGVLTELKKKLRQADFDEYEADFEARQLLAFAVGTEKFRPDQYSMTLSFEQLERLTSAVSKRLKHFPLQYIVGKWDFMGLPFKVDENVLIPRPDTETLCEEAEKLIRERGYRTLLDICTGSGCIGISLAYRNGISATLSDISEESLAIARVNAELNSVRCKILQSDLFSKVGGKFDIITANPPYIRTSVMEELQTEVKYEPRLALHGGEDGLDFYRRISETFMEHLNPGGALIMEIGFDQGENIEKLFSSLGKVKVLKDLCGQDRVVTVSV